MASWLQMSIGPALMLVLDSLDPDERLAFVLHDLFGVPFGEIAPIVGRSADATRQLASRARRRLRGAPAAGAVSTSIKDLARQRQLVDAFLAAARAGDFDGAAVPSRQRGGAAGRPGGRPVGGRQAVPWRAAAHGSPPWRRAGRPDVPRWSGRRPAGVGRRFAGRRLGTWRQPAGCVRLHLPRRQDRRARDRRRSAPDSSTRPCPLKRPRDGAPDVVVALVSGPVAIEPVFSKVASVGTASTGRPSADWWSRRALANPPRLLIRRPNRARTSSVMPGAP